MNRYAFYFVVALLAFVVGIIVVYLYFLKSQPAFELPLESILKDDFSPNVSNLQELNGLPKRADFLKDDEKALLLFESAISKWLKEEKIELVIVPSSEITQKINKGKFLYSDEQELLQNAEKVYKPYLVDVNSDGTDELAILSNCSDGNCQFWILKKTKRSFEVILSSYKEVENFKLQKSKTHGYFNIETTEKYSGAPTFFQMKIYKFGGNGYFISECFNYEYRYKDKNGNFHTRKKPKISPLHCC